MAPLPVDPSPLQWFQLLRVMVGYGLLPTVIGTGLSHDTFNAWDWVSVLTVAVGFAIGGLWLVSRRRFRLSAVVFLLVGIVLVSAPIATVRGTLGAYAGTNARYITFLPMLLGLSVAGAIRDGPEIAHPRFSPHTVWIGVAVLAALYFANLTATFETSTASRDLGNSASVVSGRIGSGLRGLGKSQRSSLVDSSAPWPVWYGSFLGVLVKGGRMSSLMPWGSSTIHAYGEGPRILGVGGNGTLHWATFVPGGSGLLYERISVDADAPTLMVVHIEGVNILWSLSLLGSFRWVWDSTRSCFPFGRQG